MEDYGSVIPIPKIIYLEPYVYKSGIVGYSHLRKERTRFVKHTQLRKKGNLKGRMVFDKPTVFYQNIVFANEKSV